MNLRFPVFVLTTLAWFIAESAFARDRTSDRRARNSQRFEQNGPKPGDPAPDFELKTTDGRVIRGANLWAGKPALLMTGSDTCPVFRREAEGFKRLAEQYRDRLNFVIVYTVEAHLEDESGPYGKGGKSRKKDSTSTATQPRSYEERAARAATCARRLDLGAPVVVDTMDNATWKAYGSAPNCAYLIDGGGKVVSQQGWFEPRETSQAIESLLARLPREQTEASAAKP